MAPILVEDELRIGRDADAVFALLTDGLRLPAWMAGVRRARRTSTPGPVHTGTSYEITGRLLGRTVTSTYEITESEPPARFSARMVSPVFSLDQTYTLEEGEGAVTVRLRGTARPSGWLRWLAPLVAVAVHRQVQADHRRLKTMLERPRRRPVATG